MADQNRWVSTPFIGQPEPVQKRQLSKSKSDKIDDAGCTLSAYVKNTIANT
jgi:hypothetical protein